MAKRSAIRASDADRDRVAERLHEAVSEGRLLAHEFEERLGRTLRARTYGELDEVVDDLPGAPVAIIPSAPPRSRQFALVRRYPVAAAALACVTAVAVVGLVVAAVAFVATGLWLLPIVGYFLMRGRSRRGRHSRRDGGLGHMHMHARRYGRF
jgi:hypothetical protein